jgi:hypothetical protein
MPDTREHIATSAAPPAVAPVSAAATPAVHAPSMTMPVPELRTVNPVLIIMMIAMAAYPFVVGYLPDSLRQYLGALFR